MKKVKTRFAPSPTGYLHIGGLRTALYNYLYAKKNNGKFILRIEDTDQSRLVDGATSDLINIIKYFDMSYDEGPDKEGNYGPYVQSERLNIYKKYLNQLINDKKAYPCFFDNDNPNHFQQETNKDIALERMHSENYVVKFKINNHILETNDEIRGVVNFDLSLIEDPIILKSDGFPTYHFANVIDDYLMGITHVIRGEEWLSSLPKHVLLYKAFNWEVPIFCHLPLLLNPDKTKLSKRQGDVKVENFLEKGYLKESLINFVALLGWNPGGKNDNEFFTIDELINLFTLEKVNKSGSIFDIEKLNWMNSIYIKNYNKKLLQSKIKKILFDNGIEINDNEQLYKLIDYGKNRISRLNDIIDEIKYFIKPNKVENKFFEKYDVENLFNFWIKELNSLDKIDSQKIDLIIQKIKKQYNIFGKNLFIPMRLALLGIEHGPDLRTIFNILDIEESINRIKQTNNQING